MAYDCSQVLVDNLGGFESTLKIMLEAMNGETEPQIRKTCIVFFVAVVKQFCPRDSVLAAAGGEQLAASFVVDFVYGRLVMDCMNILVSSQFQVRDALHLRVLNEIGNLLFTLKKARGNEEFNQHFLSKINVDGGLNLNAVALAQNEKAAQVALKEFVVAYRKKIGN